MAGYTTDFPIAVSPSQMCGRTALGDRNLSGVEGDSHVNDRADCCCAARVRRRWWLLRISKMGDRWRRRDIRAGADRRGASVSFRRVASALKKLSGDRVLGCAKTRRRIEWSCRRNPPIDKGET